MCGQKNAARRQDDPKTSQGSHQVNSQDPAGHLRMPGRHLLPGRPLGRHQDPACQGQILGITLLILFKWGINYM